MAAPDDPIDVEVLPPEPGDGKQDHLMQMLAWILDDLIPIPGTKMRFGLDPVIGLIPGAGDGSAAAVSSLLVVQAVRAGVPRIVLARMTLNIAINAIVGFIPILGNIFSLWFKSNNRNYGLLTKHAGKRKTSTVADWIFVGGLLGGILLLILGMAALFAFVVIGFWRTVFSF